MYSFPNLEPVCCSIVTSWPAYRFCRRQVRWSGIPIFPNSEKSYLYCVYLIYIYKSKFSSITTHWALVFWPFSIRGQLRDLSPNVLIYPLNILHLFFSCTPSHQELENWKCSTQFSLVFNSLEESRLKKVGGCAQFSPKLVQKSIWLFYLKPHLQPHLLLTGSP